MPAAEPMPDTPRGAKSLRWPASKAVNATTTNISRTPSLITTMMALTLADSLAPRMSSSAHIPIRTIAGRFTTPGCDSHGPADSACGNPKPKTLVTNLFR